MDSGDVGFGAVLAEFEFAFDTGDGIWKPTMAVRRCWL